MIQHSNRRAPNFGKWCADCCPLWGIRSSLKSEHVHSLGSLFIRLHYIVLQHMKTSRVALRVLRHAGTAHSHTPQRLVRSLRFVSRRVSLSLCDLLSQSPPLIFNLVVVSCCLAQPMQTHLFFSGRYWLAMDGSDTTCTFTPSDSVAYDEHKMWNPMLGL